ncbi:MAG: hypothetical protein INR71_02295 [Terriglobus roseus]|nr:hypothetical protein [Terriglobus roseus]
MSKISSPQYLGHPLVSFLAATANAACGIRHSSLLRYHLLAAGPVTTVTFSTLHGTLHAAGRAAARLGSTLVTLVRSIASPHAHLEAAQCELSARRG